jgi:hypothetical protein
MYKIKGEFPIREFRVEMSDGTIQDITIATESLEDSLDIVDNPNDNSLDMEIYFYVQDDLINLPAEEICQEHLDEPLKFIEELDIPTPKEEDDELPF